MHNPVAKFNKGRGGVFKLKDKNSRYFRAKKIKKDIEETDKEYIEVAIQDYEGEDDGLV